MNSCSREPEAGSIQIEPLVFRYVRMKTLVTYLESFSDRTGKRTDGGSNGRFCFRHPIDDKRYICIINEPDNRFTKVFLQLT